MQQSTLEVHHRRSIVTAPNPGHAAGPPRFRWSSRSGRVPRRWTARCVAAGELAACTHIVSPSQHGLPCCTHACPTLAHRTTATPLCTAVPHLATAAAARGEGAGFDAPEGVLRCLGQHSRHGWLQTQLACTAGSKAACGRWPGFALLIPTRCAASTNAAGAAPL